jgi:hypothetical protein
MTNLSTHLYLKRIRIILPGSNLAIDVFCDPGKEKKEIESLSFKLYFSRIEW